MVEHAVKESFALTLQSRPTPVIPDPFLVLKDGPSRCLSTTSPRTRVRDPDLRTCFAELFQLLTYR